MRNLGEMVPELPDSPHQRKAEEGLILRTTVGSGVIGTAVEGQDDHDEMGVFIEPWRDVLGFGGVKTYQYRTQPEGVCSGPGDLDLVVYGLKHYMHLVARKGTPTVLVPLFAPESHVHFQNQLGSELRLLVPQIVSRKLAKPFAGYLDSQRRGLLGERSGGTRNQGRADIRERYGFDVKFAMHMIRLGWQGVEILKTGRITLPTPEPTLTHLRAIRTGEVPLKECLEEALDLEADILRLEVESELPPEPDFPAIEEWMRTVYERYWL